MMEPHSAHNGASATMGENGSSCCGSAAGTPVLAHSGRRSVVRRMRLHHDAQRKLLQVRQLWRDIGLQLSSLSRWELIAARGTRVAVLCHGLFLGAHVLPVRTPSRALGSG